MFHEILAYFQHQKWKYFLPEADKTIAILGINIEKGQFTCILDVEEDNNKFIFFSIYPKLVPLELRNELGKLLLTINYRLYLGSFEMDFANGEIRVKTSLIYDNLPVSKKIIGHLIEGNISIMSQYFDLIHTLLAQKISLNQAIDKVNE